MSICCIFIIIVIIIVGALIVFVIRRLYTTIKDVIKVKHLKPNVDIETTASESVRYNEVKSLVQKPSDDADTESHDVARFSIINGNPSLQLCATKTHDECEFVEFCNVQLCRHIVSIAGIDYDKNTIKNVTYIKLPKCIIIFITKNDNVCKKEQEVKLEEDINYINSYASKYVELSIYMIYYDRELEQFYDYNQTAHDEYEININDENVKRHIMQTTYKLLPPTAPEQPSSSHTSDMGRFFYIAK